MRPLFFKKILTKRSIVCFMSISSVPPPSKLTSVNATPRPRNADCNSILIEWCLKHSKNTWWMVSSRSHHSQFGEGSSPIRLRWVLRDVCPIRRRSKVTSSALGPFSRNVIQQSTWKEDLESRLKETTYQVDLDSRIWLTTL